MLHEPCLCHYKSHKTLNFSAMAFESATKRNRVNVQVGDISKFITNWSFDLLLTWAFVITTYTPNDLINFVSG